MCPTPCLVPAPAFGTLGNCVPPVLNGLGQSCQITCIAGYNVSGSSTYCNYGTLYPQTCYESPCPINIDENGVLGNCSDGTPAGAFATSNLLPSQTDCQITCNPGYVVNGSKTSCRFGTLVETQRCVAGPCVVNPPANGNLGHCPGSLSSGYTCQLGCNNASALTGQGQAPNCPGGTNCQITIFGRTWFQYPAQTSRWMALGLTHGLTWKLRMRQYNHLDT